MNSSGVRGKKLLTLARLENVPLSREDENKFIGEVNNHQDGQFIRISNSTVNIIQNGEVQSCVMSNEPNEEIHDLFEEGMEIQNNGNDIHLNVTSNQKLPIFLEDDTYVGEVVTHDGEFINNNIENIVSRNEESVMSFIDTDEVQASNLLEENRTTDPENTNKDLGGALDGPENPESDDLDPFETVNTLTKKGTERQRKKYKLNKNARSEVKKEKNRRIHKVGGSCHQNCKFKCIPAFSEEQRYNINNEFWQLNLKEQKSFVMNSTECKTPRRKTEGSKKNKTFTYYFKDMSGTKRRVCKIFYLTTLGYRKTNDWIVHSVWNSTKTKSQIYHEDDKRGRKPPPNKLSNVQIENHIDSFNPLISHYRREHAPNRLYLPSDVTVTLMFQDFQKKFPEFICSYEKYRKVLKSKNISFAKLGNEECELCESFQLHNPEHTADSLSDDCEICCSWNEHINKAKDSRQRYSLDKEKIHDKDTICVSVDLQKIIMLPRLEMYKRAIFTQRLIAYNESFVPVGKISSERLPFGALWHEAISGRHQEDIISTFKAFFMHNRDVKHFILWLDNCSSQNKNWALYSFLVHMVNSHGISAETITIKYFEPGHTFMSADSFHHQVEESLKRIKKVYDFQDFVRAVEMCNKKRVHIKKMCLQDFQLWKNLSSQAKIKKGTPRVYISNLTEVLVKRSEFELYFKENSNNEEWKKLDFLQKKYIPNMPDPDIKREPNGFEQYKVDNILKTLGDIIPDNRKQFWIDLPKK